MCAKRNEDRPDGPSRVRTVMNLGGPSGESLLAHPFKYPVGEKDWEDRLKKMNSYMEKYAHTQDDRALALVGALSIEYELDNLLSKWIKDYRHIPENRDFTFSFKVDLALSMKLIPSKIVNAIEPIRRIRNIFAHNLDVDTFERAEEIDSRSGRPSFPMLAEKIKTFDSKPWPVKSRRRPFQQLVSIILMGLDVYTQQLTKVQNYIWESKNLDEIMKA